MRARGISIRTLGLVAVAVLAALLLSRAGAQAATTASTAAAPPILAVQVIGAGNVSGGPILCGDGNLKCAASYSTQDIDVTLVANPAAGWHFIGWVDDPGSCSSSLSCHVHGTGSQTVTARFGTDGAVDSTTLNVFLGGTGTGTVTNRRGDGSDSNYAVDCSNAGSSPPRTCSLTVVKGSTITVQERPGGGFFNGWGGSCSGTGPTCSVFLADSESISASFVSSDATQLTINVDGAGSVKTTGGQVCSGGSTCTFDEPPTANLTLTAEASQGYAFTGWTDDCSGKQTDCQVQMSTDRIVTATFKPLVPVLVTIDGDGTVTGSNVSCGPGPVTCSALVAPGETLQLTGTPGPTSTGDVSWAGCDASAGTICTVQVDNDPIEVEADFTTTGGGGTGGGGGFVAVTVHVTGDGTVTSLGTANIYCTAAGGNGCTVNVMQNTNMTLVATPAPGATFSGWSGSCAGVSVNCPLLINGGKSVSATFTGGTNATHTLTAAIAGTGSGTITGGGVRCTTTGSISCKSPEAANAPVTLTATASSGSTFTGWSGDCTGTSPICSVTMSTDKSVTANFSSSGAGGGGSSQNETLTLDVTGGGKVTIPGGACVSTNGKTNNCTSQYKSGTVVALKAVATRGFAFAGWKGSCAGQKAACTVTMDQAHTVSASFRRLALVPSSKKPTVGKLKGGVHRITLRFVTAEGGRLTAVARHSGAKPVAASKTVKVGAGLIRVTVKKTGRYVIVLTLHAKSGAHAIRYTVRI